MGAGAERWLCVAKQRAFPTLESAGSSSRGPRFFLGKAADLTDRGVRQPAGFDDVAFNHRFGFRRTVGHDISCFTPDMLTAQQYEAIGRFALAFNEIEYFLEAYVAQFLGTPNWAVGSVLAEEGFFANKLSRFTTVLSAIAKEYPALESAAKAALELAKEARELSKKRNKYIHALVVEDTRTKQTSLRVKGTVTPFNQAEVASLTAQAQGLAEKLNEASANVLIMLDEQRRSS